MTLLFRRGARPGVPAVLDWIAAAGASALLPVGFGHVAAGSGACELIVAGLCCDLQGLLPGAPAAAPAMAHWYGLAPDSLDDCEAVTIAAGEHIADGAHLLPVVRAMSVAAAILARMPGCCAVAWPPAETVMAPALFDRLVSGWIEGGPFPVPGLVGIVNDGNYAIVSAGLSFFTGQEIRFDLTSASDKNRIGKIVARLIHTFVENEPVLTPRTFIGPDGQSLIAEPIDQGRIVLIWDAN